ncbi:MAG: MucR family transcriptional regulator [Cohaesibacteraceae bacterium]
MSEENVSADGDQSALVDLTADIVAAYVSHNVVPANELSKLINDVHGALGTLVDGATEAPKVELKPAVPPKKSITPDYLICLEDGKRFKSLKRHLKTHYDLTPEQYREKWGLPADYPMVAPNYAAARSRLAKEMGLGQRRAKAS